MLPQRWVQDTSSQRCHKDLTSSITPPMLLAMRHEHLPAPLIAPILGTIAHALLPKHIRGGPYKTLQALAVLQATQSIYRPGSTICTSVGTIADMIGLTYMGTRAALTTLADTKAIAWSTRGNYGSFIDVDWLAAGLTWEAALLLEAQQKALWVHLRTQDIQEDK